jgi:hypothetical protein
MLYGPTLTGPVTVKLISDHVQHGVVLFKTISLKQPFYSRKWIISSSQRTRKEIRVKCMSGITTIIEELCQVQGDTAAADLHQRLTTSRKDALLQTDHKH